MERRVIRDLQANAPTLHFRRRNAARQAGSGSVVARQRSCPGGNSCRLGIAEQMP